VRLREKGGEREMSTNPIAWGVGILVGFLVFIVEETLVGAVGHWAIDTINATGGVYSGLTIACIVALLAIGGVAGLLKLFGKL
jgi:hypothetical protein